MISVVNEKCQMTNTNSMTIVLEGTTRDELTGMEARQAALAAARQLGFPGRGLGSVPYPYPVNDKGETNEQLLTGKEPIKAWWAEFQVNAGIGL